ncbi:MAG: glycosyltransferase family A protein [Patescibacteria group bacterium]
MISVIIPVYNHAASLKRCLESLQAQTQQDFEVIIIDDGSTDAIATVFTDISATIYGTGVAVILQQRNAGAPVARNRGAEVARGDYVLFLDADTVLAPTMLATLLDALNNSDAAYCYAWYTLHGKQFRPPEFSETELRKGNYIHTSALIRRATFPGFDPSLKRFQDWDLWLTMAANGHAGVRVPQLLYSLSEERPGISQWAPRWAYMLWSISENIFGYSPAWYRSFCAAKQVVQRKHAL